MKAVRLNIEDKEHEIVVLMSEEEAKQVCILFGKSGNHDHKDRMGRKYKQLIKSHPTYGTWHSRLWGVLVKVVFGDTAKYHSFIGKNEKA